VSQLGGRERECFTYATLSRCLKEVGKEDRLCSLHELEKSSVIFLELFLIGTVIGTNGLLSLIKKKNWRLAFHSSWPRTTPKTALRIGGASTGIRIDPV